ncbi:hypothetical protein [Enterococcus faecium]|uniref:hypothetical protein n=1 Tax=Enterococcus faecium TaxID=1352 RepID=UPI00032EB1A0|nr:hypothetical protein [Enterococcus faecium]EOF77384.1 hypothetical protein SGC_01927 [Enterococcus faecium EnGen0136]PCE04149.1 hypothetical protein CKY07_13280 [Enterococcus faecium]ROW94145.1 hypothetical protein EGW09_11605 [Enterococcus faecium]ROX46922.1 hypothetical protein EGW18_11605 [Enterococcus faecium]ROX77877.1 hypothetical protein EGW38_11400 [Enterococcus faecium]
MKRILFISLSNLLLLTACGTSASKNIPSDTQISNSIDSTISTNEKNSPVETSDIKVSTGFESIPRTRFVIIFSRFQRVSISSFRPAVKPKPFDR